MKMTIFAPGLARLFLVLAKVVAFSDEQSFYSSGLQIPHQSQGRTSSLRSPATTTSSSSQMLPQQGGPADVILDLEQRRRGGGTSTTTRPPEQEASSGTTIFSTSRSSQEQPATSSHHSAHSRSASPRSASPGGRVLGASSMGGATATSTTTRRRTTETTCGTTSTRSSPASTSNNPLSLRDFLLFIRGSSRGGVSSRSNRGIIVDKLFFLCPASCRRRLRGKARVRADWEQEDVRLCSDKLALLSRHNPDFHGYLNSRIRLSSASKQSFIAHEPWRLNLRETLRNMVLA